MEKLTITLPDDWHLHVRQGAVLKTVIAHTAAQFGRAIIMPNLNPPVTRVEQALSYRSEILQFLPEQQAFTPLMTLYLTDSTSADEIRKAADSPFIHACKLYPAGATTNSESGVTRLEAIYKTLEAMQEVDMPLLVHGEVTAQEIDIFDRERAFIETRLMQIVADFPELRVVFEHATTEEAVQFVQSASDRVAATITPQHLMFNRNALLAGGIRPHHYCLPIIKREKHRQALLTAATSGNKKFFLGTDSAPHVSRTKEAACGCAGCYSAHAAMELYTEVFEQCNALDKLEGFASFYGPDFYGLPRNKETVTLEKTGWKIPDRYSTGEDAIVPLRAGETLQWKLTRNN